MRRSFIALFFLCLPLIEIAGFVVVGSRIGALATIGLVLLSAVVGSMLLRYQGLGALRRAQAVMAHGGTPDREIIHGAMIMLAGFLLIIPGFVTDIFGILLFVPAVRDRLWSALRNQIVVRSGFGAGPQARPTRAGPKVIDLDERDYREIDENHPPLRKTEAD